MDHSVPFPLHGFDNEYFQIYSSYPLSGKEDFTLKDHNLTEGAFIRCLDDPKLSQKEGLFPSIKLNLNPQAHSNRKKIKIEPSK